MTVGEYVALTEKMAKKDDASEASPTEDIPSAVEHQKPKAGDLIEVTGDGHIPIADMAPHGFPVGAILTVRDTIMPKDRVYAANKGGRARAIHQTFYKPFVECPLGHEAPKHVFEVGDIVRVTESHNMSSRNKSGDIGVIDEISDRGSFHVYVAARDDVQAGRCHGMGYYHKARSLELVVAKKDRKN
jgi:hypothetical protein